MTEREREAVKDILKYIQEQPHAKHTAEGITRYWIYQQRLEEKLDVALGAIQYLVKAGFLSEVQTDDGQHYYEVNQAKLGAISEHIKMLENLDSSSNGDPK